VCAESHLIWQRAGKETLVAPVEHTNLVTQDNRFSETCPSCLPKNGGVSEVTPASPARVFGRAGAESLSGHPSPMNWPGSLTEVMVLFEEISRKSCANGSHPVGEGASETSSEDGA